VGLLTVTQEYGKELTRGVDFEEEINVDVYRFGFQMFNDDTSTLLSPSVSYFMDLLVGMKLERSAQGEGGGHGLEHPATASQGRILNRWIDIYNVMDRYLQR
jgi:hypothetical protein